MNEQKRLEHSWNDTGRKSSPCVVLSTANPALTEPGPLRVTAGDKPPEPWHGQYFCLEML